MTAFRNDGHITVQQERMVRKPLSPDFLDPSHEWRCLFAKACGAFLLVVAAAGGRAVAAKSNGAVTLVMIAVALGLMVMAITHCLRTSNE